MPVRDQQPATTDTHTVTHTTHATHQEQQKPHKTDKHTSTSNRTSPRYTVDRQPDEVIKETTSKEFRGELMDLAAAVVETRQLLLR